MTLLTHAGGRVYCGDPQYDAYTAYQSQTYETIWRDLRGNLWRTVRTVSNVGRSADVTPTDPDAPAPGDDRLFDKHNVTYRQRFVSANKYRLDIVRAHLQAHPGLRTAELSKLTGISRHALMRLLNSGEFRCETRTNPDMNTGGSGHFVWFLKVGA